MGENSKVIKIRVTAAQCLPLSELVVLQDVEGEALKDLTEENFEKLKNEIVTKGIAFAIHVWKMAGGKYGILDGTQRYRVLSWLGDNGYSVPPVPVNIIEAANEKEAVLLLLGGASMYGQPNDAGLYALMTKHSITPVEIQNIALSSIELKDFNQAYFGDGDTETDESLKKNHECPNCGHQWR